MLFNLFLLNDFHVSRPLLVVSIIPSNEALSLFEYGIFVLNYSLNLAFSMYTQFSANASILIQVDLKQFYKQNRILKQHLEQLAVRNFCNIRVIVDNSVTFAVGEKELMKIYILLIEY